MYADIIIDITHEKLDKIFQYSIPSDLDGVLQIGMEVIVPFGRSNRETKGYVVGFSQTTEYDVAKMKEVLCIAKDSVAIESRLVNLAAWMKDYYGGTMIQALKTVIPIKKQEKARKKRYIRLCVDVEAGRQRLEHYLHLNQRARARLLAALLDEPRQEYELVTKKLNVTRTVVRALEEQGIVSLESEQVLRNPVRHKSCRKEIPEYTREQQHAIDRFWEDYSQGIRRTYLVYGVTGSGKTEVYMEMIARVLDLSLIHI